MPERPATPQRISESYWAQTRLPLHSFVILLPLLGVFHVLESRYGSSLLAPRVVGKFLSYFGATDAILPPIMILLVLLILQAAGKAPWKVRWPVIAGMVAESVLWAVPLMGISQLAGRIAAPAAAGNGALDAACKAAMVAIGAGVYEEFVFRLVLISLAVLLFSDVLGLRRDVVTVVAVILGGVLFGLCHFPVSTLTGSTPLDWPRLVFLSLAGILWGGLLLFRGFAVAVGSHIVWDAYVFAMRA